MGYARTQGGAYPESKEEFLEYLEANRSYWTDDPSVNAGDLLVSPFDRKPVVIVPNDQIGPTGPDGYRIVAFESEGSGNERYVVNERSGVVAMESEELSRMFPKLQ